uniref:Uncharacterized protein n=1 Tax=Alexandrium catenella TaxID=2925 RepID=A0A7S1L4Q2_ALECA|mmetsp:Transcript_106297/g.282838  ORF Transcript_106297/g.282838 Transcript_106297/m.282838 type:complete len:298 (+) Transcript_106297:135-1028(+)
MKAVPAAAGSAEKAEAPVLLPRQAGDSAADVKATAPSSAEPPAAPAAEGEEALVEAARKLELSGSSGEDMKYASHRDLEPERRRLLAACFPQLAGERRVLAIVARGGDGASKEFVAVVNEGSSLELIPGTCQITFDDMTPSECIEYAFSEAPDEWAVAQISRDAMESYRSMKFDAWRNMLLHGTCEAQLRRMLQIGVVTRLYDDHVFPTPESQQAQYQVVDEKNGKVIKIPHPVSALRIWDPAQLRYESIDPQLEGAPREEEKGAWWDGMVRKLQAQMGADYINSFLTQPRNSSLKL